MKSENSSNVLFVLILSANAQEAGQLAHREEEAKVQLMQEEPAIKRLQLSDTSKGCGDLVLPRRCNLHLRWEQ